MLISVLTGRREHTYFSLWLWTRDYTQRLVWRYSEAHAWVVVVLVGLLFSFIHKYCCVSLLYTLCITSVFRCHWPLNSIVMKDEHRWDSWCVLGTRRGDSSWRTCVRVDSEELERSLPVPRPGVVCGWC